MDLEEYIHLFDCDQEEISCMTEFRGIKYVSNLRSSLRKAKRNICYGYTDYLLGAGEDKFLDSLIYEEWAPTITWRTFTLEVSNWGNGRLVNKRVASKRRKVLQESKSDYVKNSEIMNEDFCTAAERTVVRKGVPYFMANNQLHKVKWLVFSTFIDYSAKERDPIFNIDGDAMNNHVTNLCYISKEHKFKSKILHSY